MMRLIARSLKIRLESVIENIKTEKDILNKIEKCRNVAGKSFRLILWHEKVSEKSIEKFLKRNSNLLINLNTEITKNKSKFGWFTIGDKDLHHGTYRYNFVGDIMSGLNQYLELVAHIIKRENER